MRAESWQNRLQLVAVILPRVARHIAGTEVHAAVIGRHGQHAASWSKLRQTLRKPAL
jgi:hypothetical protein